MTLFGTSPNAWAIDDDPALGRHIPTTQILREAVEAGFDGIEHSHRFPEDPNALKDLLDEAGLRLVSGWIPLNLLVESVAEQKAAIQPHLDRLKHMGCTICTACEASNAIQGTDRPLSQKPVLTSDQMAAFGAKVEQIAQYCADQGIELVYHPHLGSVVSSPEEIDAFMAATGPATRLLFDTGHYYCGSHGLDPAPALARHLSRVGHVHAMNVRTAVMQDMRERDLSFRDGVRRGLFTVPGDIEGGMDFASCLSHLKTAAYKGWIVIESAQDPSTSAPIEYQTLGLNTLKTIASEVGLT